MMTTPRLSLLIPDLRSGGAERVFVNLANSFISKGFNVDLLLMRKHGELLTLVDSNIEVIDLDAYRIRAAFSPLVRYLKVREPAVLMVAMWPLTVLSILAGAVARFKGKVVVSDHVAFSLSPQTATVWRRVFFRATVFLSYPRAFQRIAVSQGVVDDLAALSRLPKAAFRVIYNPAAVDVLQRESVDAPLTMSDARVKQILAVGTLKPQKGFGLLLQAFAELRRHTAAHLTILGEGAERARLEASVRELGLQESVSLPGSVLDTSPFYSAADLFVLSSKFEGFGNVIVEALSHGVNVVSTDCHSGPREILSGGLYGMLVPVDDVEALAAGMAAALAQPIAPDVLRRRALLFHPSRIASEYLEAFGLAR